MISESIYHNFGKTVRVRLAETHVWQASREEILNFPLLVELADRQLYLGVRRRQHGTTNEEPTYYLISTDDGDTWRPAPEGMEFGNGGIGYFRDGSIVRLHHNTLEADAKNWKRKEGLFHNVAQQEDPTFRMRRWDAHGEYIETIDFKVDGMPWEVASYQCYAKILEMENGDLLTALEAHVGPIGQPVKDRNGKLQHYFRNFVVFIIRSSDRGKSWKLMKVFGRDEEKSVWGPFDKPVDEGFAEADLVALADDNVLCIMRTGSYSPLYQARSTDEGNTWGEPENTGWPGVRPRIQLLPNGVLTCAAGRGAYGHPQTTHVMISIDGKGEHWEYPFAFHTGPGCSYTQTMIRDGALHVVYSHSDFMRPFGTHGLDSQTIKRSVISVDIL